VDVLDSFDEIKLCINYKIRGQKTAVFPTDINRLKQVEPVYKTMPGWKTNSNSFNSKAEMPAALVNYLSFIEEYLGIKIKIISTGPKRSETIRCEH
jgi:adenylosuccinate synthase